MVKWTYIMQHMLIKLLYITEIHRRNQWVEFWGLRTAQLEKENNFIRKHKNHYGMRRSVTSVDEICFTGRLFVCLSVCLSVCYQLHE